MRDYKLSHFPNDFIRETRGRMIPLVMLPQKKNQETCCLVLASEEAALCSAQPPLESQKMPKWVAGRWTESSAERLAPYNFPYRKHNE